MDRPFERRTAARTAVVWDAVRALLDDSPGEQRVLDIGGGTGGFAVRLAGLGHRVTVVDPSPDALAALARRAAEDDVADRVTGLQGDLGNLAELAPDTDHTLADLVLCHGVLGLVDDPAAALATITSVLRPGGALSLLVNQRHAAVLARAMAGHFVQAREILEGDQSAARDRGERRFTAEEVAQLLGLAGFTTTSTHGIRVFSDLVPSSLLDLEPGAGAALLDLERAVADRPDYLTLASQLHVLATR
jgi:SAM-dependent methyltransferase